MDRPKRFIYSANSRILLLITLGILVLLNIISVRHFGRIDLTSDEQYTISLETKQMLGALDDTVTIKAYFSEKLPPNLLSLPQFTRDILEEYKAFSKGNLIFRFLDPAEKEEIAIEARQIGIPEARLNVPEKDKYTVQAVYFGMGIFYRDRKETIAIVNPTTLEYDLTSAIKKVISPEVKSIGFLSGHDEPSINDSGQQQGEYATLARLLEKNYKITTVDVSKGEPIKDVTTLIVAGVKKDLSERELFEIDQFMSNGGAVIFLVDEFKVDYGLLANNISHNLSRLLNTFGIKAIDEMVLDQSHTNASFKQGFVSFVLPYPFWVRISKDSTANSHPTTANLDGLVIPWASPLNIEKKEGITTEIIASTTQFGWTAKGTPNLDPGQEWNIPKDQLKSYPLVAFAKGKYKSIFDSVPAVSKQSEQNSNADTIAISEPSNEENFSRQLKKESDSEVSVVVIGSSRFIDNIFIDQFQQNGAFFLNIVDFISLDPSLINIRSKGITLRPLIEINDAKKTLIKVLGIMGMPLVVIVFGIIRHIRRKKKRLVVFY